jgi:hypothetical protein
VGQVEKERQLEISGGEVQDEQAKCQSRAIGSVSVSDCDGVQETGATPAAATPAAAQGRTGAAAAETHGSILG